MFFQFCYMYNFLIVLWEHFLYYKRFLKTNYYGNVMKGVKHKDLERGVGEEKRRGKELKRKATWELLLFIMLIHAYKTCGLFILFTFPM